MMMYGFASLWHIFKQAGLFLTDEEISQLRVARACALQGYHLLSHTAASHLPRPHFKFPIKPKLHKMDHMLRLAEETRINPGWLWGFSDEDLVGRMAKMSACVHASRVGNRAVERWLMFFFSEFAP